MKYEFDIHPTFTAKAKWEQCLVKIGNGYSDESHETFHA